MMRRPLPQCSSLPDAGRRNIQSPNRNRLHHLLSLATEAFLTKCHSRANKRSLKARCDSWLEDANHPKILALENDKSACRQ